MTKEEYILLQKKCAINLASGDERPRLLVAGFRELTTQIISRSIAITQMVGYYHHIKKGWLITAAPRKRREPIIPIDFRVNDVKYDTEKGMMIKTTLQVTVFDYDDGYLVVDDYYFGVF